MFPFLNRTLTVRIEFPALDRLVTLIETRQQEQVDALTAKIAQATEALKTSTSGLDQAVQTQEH